LRLVLADDGDVSTAILADFGFVGIRRLGHHRNVAISILHEIGIVPLSFEDIQSSGL
jgi:hypothetical protein